MRDLSRWVTLSVAFLVPIAWAATAHAQSLSEADAVARALASSPRLRAARARSAQVAADERARRTVANPSIRVQQESAAGVRDRFVLVEQELALDGRRGLLAQAAVHAVGAADAQVLADAQVVRRDTRAAYTQLLAAEARERVLANGLTTLEALTERLRAREQAGDGSAFDRLRTERELADFMADRRATATAVSVARAQLAAAIGESAGGATLTASDDLARLPAPATLDTVLDAARTRRPALRAAQADIDRLTFERRAAARLSWVQPFVSGGWKQTDDGGRADSGYAFSLGVAVPVFRRGVAETTSIANALLGAEATRDAVTREIDTEVRVAHAQAVDGRARAAAYAEEALARSRDLVRIATLAYDEGEIGILELLDAHRTLLGAELRTLDLRVEARLAAIALDYSTAEEVMR